MIILQLRPHIEAGGYHLDRFDAFLDGELLTTSRQPVFDGARALIERGHDPHEIMCADQNGLLPERKQFKSRQHDQATALHELAHWTGHERRLDRAFGRRFGDNAYAAEELVAELAAAFLCAELGITGTSSIGKKNALATALEFVREGDTLVVSILELRQQGVGATAIARLVGVSRASVYRVMASQDIDRLPAPEA